jgi:mRNA-degrading endonuclease RelE of RelBE toxin-antitoxin system
MYSVRFPSESLEAKFTKALAAVPHINLRLKIASEIEKLGNDPYPAGKKFKSLRPPLYLFQRTATCRLRVGDYRVLYDVDETSKIVWILALRLRSEHTYS